MATAAMSENDFLNSKLVRNEGYLKTGRSGVQIGL